MCGGGDYADLEKELKLPSLSRKCIPIVSRQRMTWEPGIFQWIITIEWWQQNCERQEDAKPICSACRIKIGSSGSKWQRFRPPSITFYQDERTSDFFIGPEVETDKGPWTSATEYYTNLANHALQACAHNATPEIQTSCSFALPVLFKHLMSLYGWSCSTGGGLFRLVNRDFGPTTFSWTISRSPST